MKDYSYHPVNLGLRFILEIVVLIAAGMFAKEHFSWISAILLPVVLMTCWSVFAVRGDKSRSGKTVVPTPGKLRILIELLFFVIGIIAWIGLQFNWIAIINIGALIIHHALSGNRLKWLWAQTP